MKKFRLLESLLLFHLFDLPEEKIEWLARLVFLASIILFACSVMFTLSFFQVTPQISPSRLSQVAGQVDHLGLLASLAFFISSILAFLGISFEDTEIRGRILWLASITLLLGSIILLLTLLKVYTTSPVLNV